tara:strand:+ start:137 stop:313 length:177 start_codon:yes stop_codon:yes gene_type:complete
MTHDERRLLRHLVIAVIVKLVVLTALWWVFVRDHHVQVDAEQSAQQLGITSAATGATP